MVSKDQAIGGVICLVCVLVAIGYTILVIFPGEIASFLSIKSSGDSIRIIAVLAPVLVAFIAILAIGAWIGWTMATTPAPKPIEEINTDDTKAEENKNA